MAMWHGRPWPCCEVRHGRCTNITRREYWSNEAWLWAQGVIHDLFGTRAAGRFIDWRFSHRPPDCSEQERVHRG